MYICVFFFFFLRRPILFVSRVRVLFLFAIHEFFHFDVICILLFEKFPFVVPFWCLRWTFWICDMKSPWWCFGSNTCMCEIWKYSWCQLVSRENEKATEIRHIYLGTWKPFKNAGDVSNLNIKIIYKVTIVL